MEISSTGIKRLEIPSARLTAWRTLSRCIHLVSFAYFPFRITSHTPETTVPYSPFLPRITPQAIPEKHPYIPKLFGKAPPCTRHACLHTHTADLLSQPASSTTVHRIESSRNAIFTIVISTYLSRGEHDSSRPNFPVPTAEELNEHERSHCIVYINNGAHLF
jgi:hypothetical protein